MGDPEQQTAVCSSALGVLVGPVVRGHPEPSEDRLAGSMVPTPHREGRLKWDFGRLSVAEDGKIWTRRQESAWKKGFLYIGEKEGLPKVKYLPRGVLKFYCISESPGRAFRQPVSPDHNTHQLQGTIRG